ncbi:sphingomyelin phosphodiesterase 4-like [Babylonia areolata]|uniref:sphingomyelin phosphodiesterase 4-like n=1 Tax=Babylonia areolata TaxID=304850 RepID=UPI003FD58C24
MAAYGPSSLRYQIEGLQSKSVIDKCRVTEDLLKRTSTKELHLVFPALLNSVFGGEGEPGWGLEKISKSHQPHDFSAVRKFLAPEGPLLSAVSSLQADPYASYVFPFRCLPGPSRHTIEEGGVPLFYINKLQTHGFSMPTIVLNPFEMYMFTFAYALVSPAWQQEGTTWSARLFDWLYPTLVDDYFSHFLPLEGSDLPSVPVLPSPLRSPLPQPSVSGRPVQRNVPFSPPRAQRVSLFKPSFMLAQKQHIHAASVLDSSEAETWCSETMLQIFVEFWLNQNSLVAEIPTFAHGAMSSMYYGQKAGGFHYLFEHFMPSLNQVLVVRMMVKYLHYFTNTATPIITSPYQQRVETPLHHFKRTVVPQLVQKKLYWFLRHAFDRWPLDCYFRMVLETWLSYIQPWRYTDVKHYTRGKDSHPHKQDPKDRKVEDKWQHFVEDNLLFYSVLFLELFPRLSRMDFTSPHSAYVLFRLTKVLKTPNLATLLSNAEHEVCGVSVPVPMSHTAELGGSYLSASRLPPPAPSLPPALADMEVAGFQYQPLFCDWTRRLVNGLLQKVVEAHLALTTVQPEKSSGGWWGWLSVLFEGDEGQGSMDANRTHKYLQQAGSSLTSLFDLPRPQWANERSPQDQSMDSWQDTTLVEEDNMTPDCIHTPEGPQLTARGRYQIINNLRSFQHWQTRDPDLQPIRSFENATLVRFLYRICSAFNAHFSEDIWEVYQRQDFVGRLAKVFLAPPLPPDQAIRSPVPAHTASSLRMPRVSLRPLASYQTLGLLALTYMFLHTWLSLGPFSYTLLLLAALVVYGMLRALFTPVSS